MTTRTLAELEADCIRWREVSHSMLDLGQRALDTARLCNEVGWPETAIAFGIMADGIARCLESTVLPALEAHHVEHLAAKMECARLERELGEAS